MVLEGRGEDEKAVWTNCDWVGENDDLIDHIMEIHVELQPYHNFKDIISSSLSPSVSSSSSADTFALAIPPQAPVVIAENCTTCSANDDEVSSNSNSNSINAANTINCQNSIDCHKWGTNGTNGTNGTSHFDTPTQLYVCLWEGCKVYGKGSLSKSWIERHVLQHSGPRPFKCIVEGCNERFKKREALERHVNSHFIPTVNGHHNLSLPNIPDTNSQGQLANGKSDMHCPAQMSPKNAANSFYLNRLIGGSGSINRNKTLIKRKKTKSRKKYISVKASEDYFDESVMELINFRLAEISMLTGLDVLGNQSDLVFHSKVIGKCCPDKDGATKVLLRWEPEGIMPDEWVSESDLSEMSSRRVPLKALPIDSLSKILERPTERRSRGRKFRKE